MQRRSAAHLQQANSVPASHQLAALAACSCRGPQPLLAYVPLGPNTMTSALCMLQRLTARALPQGIGDDAESVVSSSATIAESEAGYLPVFFEPRPLVNLQLVDQMPSLSPITDMKVSLAHKFPKSRILPPASVQHRAGEPNALPDHLTT